MNRKITQQIMPATAITPNSIANTIPHRRMLKKRIWQLLTMIAYALPLGGLITLIFLPLLALSFFAMGISLDNWAVLLTEHIPPYVVNTLLLVLGGGLVCLLWGVSCAWLTANFNFYGRRYISWMLILPLACPVYISGFIYSDIFAAIVPGFHGIPVASLLFGAAFYPYVYILSLAAFRQQSMDYVWAAQTMGLNDWQIFKRISLPIALPFISFGMLLATIEIINDFGLVNHYSINTMSLGIYRVWLGLGDFNGAVGLSLITLVVLMVIMIAEAYLIGKRKRYENQSRHSPVRVKRLAAVPGTLCLLWCLLPIVVGFFAPVAILSYYAIDTLYITGGARFQELGQALANTLSLALLAIAVILICAILINYSARRLSKFWRVAGQSINICYALPGTLLAFTCILFFSKLNQLLPEYLAIGGLTVLIFAYTIRFIPPANRSIYNGLLQITPPLEMAARIFAIKPLTLLTKIHLPLLKGALISSCLIIFAELLKELPLVLILRPFNFETLASFTYQYANDERLGLAALPALIIIFTGVPVLYLLHRYLNRSRGEKTF